MSEQRNILLFIVLSALILLGWNLAADRFLPTAGPQTTKVEAGRQVALPQPGADPAADSPAALRNRTVVLAETPRVAIATPRLQGSINLRGPRIDDLVLLSHRESLGRNAPPIRLLSPGGAADAYFASFGWTGAAAPGPDTIWRASGPRLTPGTPVTLSADNGRGQVFELILSVDPNYMFTVRQRVVNRGAAPVAVRPFGLVSRAGKSRDADSWTIHVGPSGVFNGAVNHKVDYDTLDEDGEARFASTGGWLGFGDKYWLTALVPDQRAPLDAAFRRAGGGGYQADFAAPAAIVEPGRAFERAARFFAGAKEVSVLNAYEDAGIPLFSRAVDWGWFSFIERPIFSLLRFLFSSIGNFGLAIMALTLIVRLAMFPVAQKQFASMAAMRVLQPKMKALQERFADDKPRLQQETMKLYQQEKVNPLAGCLPILIQIPIFYALYKVLLLSVEMRHQPFFGWIKDLSAPDPLTPVNLFGLLDFTPPGFLLIGVLPILVGLTSWLSFKLNPASPDPVQQQVFSVMPWLFIFIMAPFAAGLQLYWVTNNILTIAQQSWLYSRYPGMKQAVAT